MGDGLASAGEGAEWISVAFHPGVVRFGRVIGREDRSLVGEFSKLHRQTLAVGAEVKISVRHGVPATAPTDAAMVVERCDRFACRHYRFLPPSEHPAPWSPPEALETSPFSSPRLPRPLPVALRFGQLEFAAEIISADHKEFEIAVTRADESRLRHADAMELSVPQQDERPEIRVVGWLKYRLLKGDFVHYAYQIDESLTDDGAREHARLRALVSQRSRLGESSP
jgi:hypothetical protein